MTALVSNLPSAKNARLPVVYEKARDALEKCSSIDECKDWANKADAIASYAKQAEDETLMHSAQRIKARAIRRCGELLKEIETGKAGRPPKVASTSNGKSVGAPPPISRAQVAKDAGLSKDQRIQAQRVASIPRDDFERAVEAPKPPTVTELAQRGKKPAPVQSTEHLRGRDPKDYLASTRAQGGLRHFVAEVAVPIDPARAVCGALPHERARMLDHAKTAAAWIEKLQTELERSR